MRTLLGNCIIDIYQNEASDDANHTEVCTSVATTTDGLPNLKALLPRCGVSSQEPSQAYVGVKQRHELVMVGIQSQQMLETSERLACTDLIGFIVHDGLICANRSKILVRRMTTHATLYCKYISTMVIVWRNSPTHADFLHLASYDITYVSYVMSNRSISPCLFDISELIINIPGISC